MSSSSAALIFPTISSAEIKALSSATAAECLILELDRSPRRSNGASFG
jgi:hypothetical protein